MKFVNWDRRPAVLFDGAALAVLRPGGNWEAVDWLDVSNSAGVLDEADWRARFEPKFGPLRPPSAPPIDGSEAPMAAE